MMRLEARKLEAGTYYRFYDKIYTERVSLRRKKIEICISIDYNKILISHYHIGFFFKDKDLMTRTGESFV